MRRGFGKRPRSYNNRALRNIKRKLRSVEMKYHTAGAGNQTVTATTGWVQGLNIIAQGDGVDQRNGLKITPVRLNLKMHFKVNSSATAYQVIRWMVICDKHNGTISNGADPILANVMAGNVMALQVLNLVNVKRYKILAAGRCMLWKTYDRQEKIVSKVINLRKIGNIGFRNDGSSVTSTGPNSLSLMIFTNESTNQPTFDYYSRLRFYDG